ncbi:MAG: sigma-70 family RNA polymerase sigma factor [Clostridia bacterium]|nr:sigma-70 family RNA polymerase sigma factor [Clostridia bacterium]
MDNGASSYRRYLDGDESAFDEVLKMYRDSLTFFINRYVQDMATAEDIAIDVFTDLIIHKHRYNFKTQLKTYLFMIGRCRALDYIKHRNKFVMVEWTSAETELINDTTPEDSVLADERKRVINSALEKLPEDMKVVIHLIYFEELSYAEAAKIMKKSRKQVDNLLYRAKSLLKSIIGKEGELLL